VAMDLVPPFGGLVGDLVAVPGLILVRGPALLPARRRRLDNFLNAFLRYLLLGGVAAHCRRLIGGERAEPLFLAQLAGQVFPKLVGFRTHLLPFVLSLRASRSSILLLILSLTLVRVT